MTHYSDFKLTLRDDGIAELEQNGEQVWASDSDEDLVERLGQRALALRPRDLGEVLDHLVDVQIMTDSQADSCIVDPGEEEEEGDEDDEDDEDEDEDEED